MKANQRIETMSVSSMRAELLEIAAVLFPETTWRSRVPARELAEFTLERLSDRRKIPRLHGQRAVGLAVEIMKRTKRPPRRPA